MNGRVVRGFVGGLIVGALMMGLIRLGAWLERRTMPGVQPDTVYIAETQPSSGTPQQSAQNVEPNQFRGRINDEVSSDRRNGITHAIQVAEPAVVGITVTQVREVRPSNPLLNDPFYRRFFGIPDEYFKQKVENLGSGFLISPDGLIVTNEHVVHMASEIMVTMNDGRSWKAELLGADYDSDIALVKIEADSLTYLRISQDDDLIVGEWVMAIGNPFGLFKVNDQASVSVGVVSAVGRNFERQEDGRFYRNMIQTDAAINPGNSGGPLVNVLGEVIGVNTFIFTGGGSGSVGVGFALPASVLRDVIDELKERGQVDSDYWTGLYVQNLDRLVAISLGYRGQTGVVVTEVEEGSPGYVAGIQPADIILEIRGTEITDGHAIRRYFNNHDFRVGDTLPMKVFREGKTLEAELTLEARPK